MAKLVAKKIGHRFSNNNIKFRAEFPDCGTRTSMDQGGPSGKRKVFQDCSFAKGLCVAHTFNHGCWQLAVGGDWRLAVGGGFFKAWRSPAESIAPKRHDHGQSVHGEPKFTKDSDYCTQNPTPRVLNTLH